MRKKKIAEKLVLDFGPQDTGVWVRRRTHVYLHLRDLEVEGQFLTMESGAITVVTLPTMIPDKGPHTYRVYYDRENYEDLERYDYDLRRAVEKFHSSLLKRTAEAEREMRRILGLQELEEGVTDEQLAEQAPKPRRARKEPPSPSSEPAKPSREPGVGYSLQTLCGELGIDPTDARKHLRQHKVEKPGGRWEWPNAEAAASVRSLLEAMPR